MPVFRLCLREHGHLDTEGVAEAYPSLEEAVLDATRQARSIVSEQVRKGGEIDLRGSIEVADEHGQRLDVVSFAKAVKVRR